MEEVPEDIVNLISAGFMNMKISELGLTQKQLDAMNPDFEFNLEQTGEERAAGNIFAIMLISMVLFFAIYYSAFQVSSSITTEKTSKIIDAYHKMINVNRNKMEMKKKRDNILKKVQNRANKNYVFSRGKTDYNVVLVDKNREMERIKNKKYIKNEDIWDFLHDV